VFDPARPTVYFYDVNLFTKLTFCLAGGLFLNATLRAETAPTNSGPYALMVERNIFALNPPPPPPDPNQHIIEPPVKITLNGIMSVFGQMKAFFKVAGKTPGKEDSYMLTEGQGEDNILVVKINEKGGEVTFNNHGMEQIVPLAVSTGSGAGAGLPRPGGIPGISGGISANPGNSGSIITIGGSGSSSSGIGGGIPSPDAGTNLRAVPTRYGSQTPAIDPVVQTVLIEANRLDAQNKGDPISKIFPITELTPLLTPPADSGGAAAP